MSAWRHITSRDNPLVREAALLAESARERRKRGESFIEGVHLCQAWLQHRGAPRVALVAASVRDDPEVAALMAACPQGAVLDDAVFRAFSQLAQGAGIAFLVATPPVALPDRIHTDCVYLDRIQDPGNMGSLLRSAAAAGIGLVITAPQTVFAWSPKVLRAGMGAHFALTIVEGLPWPEVRARLAVRALGTRLEESVPLHRADLRAPACWLFGNEGEGVSVDPDRIDWLRIDQSDAVESLNVAAAAAVCFFEQRRQRAADAA